MESLKTKKVGLMGGTFDPIHLGHLEIGYFAKEEFDLDEVWFMPTGNSYHKHKQAVSTLDRCSMVKEAIREEPSFAFCDVECTREGATYTAETLPLLQKKYPEIQFFYIVGADSLAYMEKWYQPQVIFDHAVILAAKRQTQTQVEMEQKAEELKMRFHADIRFIQKPVLSVSSSEVREKLSKGESVAGLIPDAVIAYIREHHLYQFERGMESRNR